MKIDFKPIIKRKNPIILDIGTYDGADSVKFLEIFPEAKIYAFEADPYIWPIFEEYVSKYIEYPNSHLELIKYAVGNSNEDKIWYRSIWDRPVDGVIQPVGPSGTLNNPTGHLGVYPFVSFYETIIKCIKLDDWFKNQNIDYIDFAWTDVNGAERELIEGGENVFNNHTKYLQLECHNIQLWENQTSKEQLIKMLPNFELIEEHGINLIFKNKYI